MIDEWIWLHKVEFIVFGVGLVLGYAVGVIRTIYNETAE